MNSSFAPEAILPVWLQRLLAAAVCISIGSFLINQIYDLDVWWQVTIGRDILAHGSVPVADRFTAMALGRPYHDSHWLFQVLLASADRIGGMLAVQWVMIALWLAVFTCVQRASRRWVPILYWGPLLFLAAMASTERFLPRPELITFLGIAFFYWKLQEGRYRTWRDLAALMLMQLLWTNGHGLFVLGPFLVGCYWLVAAVGGREPGRGALPALSRLLAMILVVTLLTPYGWDNWRYAMLLFQEVGPQAPKLLKSVGELSPTFGSASMGGVAFWFFLSLLLLTVLLIVWSFLRKRQIAIARLLIVAAMLVAALSGRRNMVLFVLVAAPFAAELLSRLPTYSRRCQSFSALVAAVLMLGWCWYPVSGNYYLNMELPSRTGFGATSSFFPHGLPDFLKKIGYRGQVFNSNTLGGFYLYHRYPQQVSFTDGRWEIYAASTFDEIDRGTATSATWQFFAKKYGVTGVLLQHASHESRRLLPLLRESQAWRLVYLDASASFWVGADDYHLTPTLSLGATDPLPDVQRLDDCLILEMFLQQMAADHMRVRNLERAIGFGRNLETLLFKLGATLVKMKDYARAQTVFERLHTEYPENIAALNELAFFAYQRGDLSQAEVFLQQVLQLSPENADAQTNLKRVRDVR